MLVMKTLPHLRLVDAKWLDYQPKMNMVGVKGVAFHQDQLFIFYATLLELQKIIDKSLQESAAQNDNDGTLNINEEKLRTASYHNLQLIKLFFKFLYRADGKTSKIILTTTNDAKKFNRHFMFLQKMFPFL